MKTVLIITLISIFNYNLHSADDPLVDHSVLIKKLMMQNSNLLSLISEIREQEKLEDQNAIQLEIEKPKHISIPNPTKNTVYTKKYHVIKPKKVINLNKSIDSTSDTESQLIELMKKQATKYQEVILELEEEENRFSISAGQRYDMDRAKNSSKYAQLGVGIAEKTYAIVEVQKRQINDIFSGSVNNVCIGLKKYFTQRDENITPYGAVMYKAQFANLGGDLSYDLDKSSVHSMAARLGIECKIDKHAKFDLFYEKGGKDDHLLKVDGSIRTIKAEKSVIGMGVNYEF